MKISREVRLETAEGMAGELIGWYAVDESKASAFSGEYFTDEDGIVYPWGYISEPCQAGMMCILVRNPDVHQRLCYDKNFTPIRKE